MYPTIVGLMPIMGTLTSYVRADYIDLEEHSTTFFSTIWAPPSAGKSFAKRLVDMLMNKIRLRREGLPTGHGLHVLLVAGQGKGEEGDQGLRALVYGQRPA